MSFYCNCSNFEQIVVLGKLKQIIGIKFANTFWKLTTCQWQVKCLKITFHHARYLLPLQQICESSFWKVFLDHLLANFKPAYFWLLPVPIRKRNLLLTSSKIHLKNFFALLTKNWLRIKILAHRKTFFFYFRNIG